MSNPDGSDKVNGSLGLQQLEGLEDFVLVGGQCHVYLCAEWIESQ